MDTFHVHLNRNGGKWRVVLMARDHDDARAQGERIAREQGGRVERVRRAPFRHSNFPRR